MNHCSWGPVSAGILITAIAAGLRPEKVPLLELFKNKAGGDKPYLAELTLDNRWFATLAGNDTFLYLSSIFLFFLFLLIFYAN